MPGLTGLDVLSKHGLSKRPYTVIVSAHHDYALQAYDVRAMDYLLKPVDTARFGQALTRLRAYLDLEQRADGRMDVDELLRRLQQPGSGKSQAEPVSDRVPVKIGRRVRFLSLEHISHLLADGSYVNLHMTTGEVIHTSERISQMEAKLAAQHFIRIHRSVILNIDQIRDVRSTGARYEFAMLSGGTMTSGVTYKMNIQNLLARWKKSGDVRIT
jgi:two-component system LytT family response regulator